MASTELTQRQWREVMGYNPSKNKGCDDCPVEQISWNEAQGFIGILNANTGFNFRLPTESEWEYAAKMNDSSTIWKEADTAILKTKCWFYLNGEDKTHPVGLKKPGTKGLYDMHANVREWCFDLYGYYNSKKDAIIPMKSGWRCARGGGWFDDLLKCRPTYRFYQEPEERSEFVGFRLAMN